MKFIHGNTDGGKSRKHLYLRLIILTVFWVVIFIAADPLGPDNMATHSDYQSFLGGSQYGITPRLARGVKIVQPLQLRYNNLKGLDIRFGTYGQKSHARFNLSLRDSEGSSVYRETIESRALEDNQFYHIDIPEQADCKGKAYELVVTGSNGTEDNAPTIWAKTPNGDPTAIVNGEESDFVLEVRLTYRRGEIYSTMLILIVILSYVFALLAGKPDERTFLCLCLVLGVLYVVLTPFSHPLDEYTHFLKAYAISNFNPREDVVNGDIGFVVPYNISSIPEVSLGTNFDRATRPFEHMDDFVSNRHTSSIIPINHAIIAIGLLIARLLHLGLGMTLWFGRLFVYLFYVGVCYLAIKNAKYYKSVFFTIAALPAAVWMAASFSTDPILLSTSLLFASICMKYRFNDAPTKLTRRDIIALMLCGTCVASVKYFIYLPVLTTFFLIPKDCFEKKQRRNMILAATLVVLVLAVWQYRLLKRYPIMEDRTLSATSFTGQIQFVFSHPYYTLRNFLSWLMTTLFPRINNTYYQSVYPAMSSTLGMLGLFTALIASDKYPAERIDRPHAVRIHLLVIFMLSTVMILASLYAAFTAVGAFTIDGVQSRYFQPILICVMLPMAMTRIENRDDSHPTALVMMTEIALLMSMVGLLMDAML